MLLSTSMLYVRLINACLCHHEPEAMCRDYEVGAAFYDLDGFTQNNLEETSILACVLGKLSGASRWLHIHQPYISSFRFRNDLLSDNENVVAIKPQPGRGHGVLDEFGEVVTGLYGWNALKSEVLYATTNKHGS